MDFELPANVSVHKQDQPKGWSYPLKTSEVVTILDLGALDHKFSIFYMNSRPGPTRNRNEKRRDEPYYFNIFSVSWYGHIAAKKSTIETGPRFHMGVHLVKPEYRQRLNKILREEVFPVVLRWLKDCHRLPYINGISLDYHRLDDSTGAHKFEWGLELRENGERRLWHKVIDLDKKDEEKKDGEQGPVLEEG